MELKTAKDSLLGYLIEGMGLLRYCQRLQPLD